MPEPPQDAQQQTHRGGSYAEATVFYMSLIHSLIPVLGLAELPTSNTKNQLQCFREA